jgi:hypothetical protein
MIRDRLIAEDSKSIEIIKPILRGRDIKRYGYEWANLWAICIFPSLKLEINDYPGVRNHLLGSFNLKQLEQSGIKYPDL